MIDFKAWSKVTFTEQVISADGTFISAITSFIDAATLLRFRGYIQAIMDSTVQVGDRIVLTFGLGIVSTDAATVGATAVPDPGSDPDYPWLWWGEMNLESEWVRTSATDGAWGPSAQRIEVDSKAMRRVKPKESLLWVVQASSTVGAPVTLVTMGSTRFLIGT